MQTQMPLGNIEGGTRRVVLENLWLGKGNCSSNDPTEAGRYNCCNFTGACIVLFIRKEGVLELSIVTNLADQCSKTNVKTVLQVFCDTIWPNSSCSYQKTSHHPTLLLFRLKGYWTSFAPRIKVSSLQNATERLNQHVIILVSHIQQEVIWNMSDSDLES